MSTPTTTPIKSSLPATPSAMKSIVGTPSSIKKAVSFEPLPEPPSTATRSEKLELVRMRRALQRAELEHKGRYEVVERPSPGEISSNGGKDRDVIQSRAENWIESGADDDDDDQRLDEMLALDWEQIQLKRDLLPTCDGEEEEVVGEKQEEGKLRGEGGGMIWKKDDMVTEHKDIEE